MQTILPYKTSYLLEGKSEQYVSVFHGFVIAQYDSSLNDICGRGVNSSAQWTSIPEGRGDTLSKDAILSLLKSIVYGNDAQRL